MKPNLLIKRKFFSSVAMLLLLFTMASAQAFTCRVSATGQTVGAGNVNVHINLQPRIDVGQNLVVDISSAIQCRNDSTPNGHIDVDHVHLTSGSAYGGALSMFKGSLYWHGRSWPFPLTSSTDVYDINQTYWIPLPLKLYLTAVGAAGGVVIHSGELIAVLHMYKIATDYGGAPKNFTWNIYASNSVVVPTGGCDVSGRDVVVSLPDYPGSVAVPLTVYCAKPQQLAYSLSGTTADVSRTIFSNTASGQAAAGIGVQLLHDGRAIAVGDTIVLGKVASSPVNLGLRASYARTGERITAGNVRSVIGVTFVYL